MASMRTGTSSSYSRVTWVLPSGRRKSTCLLLADRGELPRERVGVVDGRRHELGRLVGGVAEHQALVAGALLLVQAVALVHALRDVGALLLDRR